MNAENWNVFLAAEISPARGRAILQSLDLSSSWLGQLLRHPDLSPGERKRLEGYRAPTSHTETILTESGYSPQIAHAGLFLPAIHVDGTREWLVKPCIGIVGTRSATSYGRVCARKFAEEFARHGAVVVSGGAVGIDADAHSAALDAGGETIAVLANGVDHVYPSANAGLFERIKTNGALVSQFALGTKPADYKFILRNQLIAAICDAVVVIQAPLKSGAIRTAGFAGEMGREVFVVPGPIDQFGFQGSHALIRDGATLVDHPMQVLETLGIDFQSKTSPVAQGPAAQILAVLSSSAIPVEKIVELTGLSTSDVLSELTLLELDGQVMRDPGGFSKAL